MYKDKIRGLLSQVEKMKATYDAAQAKHDEYNKTAGPMDYDFDCCDYSYQKAA